MTKNLILLFCLCLLVMIWACNQNSGLQPADYSIVNAQKYIEDYNAVKLPHDKGQFYTGAVYIRAANEDQMAIYVVSSEKEKTELFLLQMPKNEDKDFRLEIKKAQVWYFKNQLLINAIEEDLKLKFTLSNAEKLAIEKNEEIQFKHTYAGYGMIHIPNFQYTTDLKATSPRSTIDFGNPGDPVGPPQAVSCQCRIKGGNDKDCDSGGYGALSCSVAMSGDACTATCESAYFACCIN